MSDTSAGPPAGPIRVTYRDLARWPDDGRRYEILDGELFELPSPTTRHQQVSIRLATELVLQLARTGAGEVCCAPLDVLLSEDTVLQPDLLYVRSERLSILETPYVNGPPDLVVEILSPSTASRDRLKKVAAYARFGVPNLWIVDPGSNRIEMFSLAGGRYRRRLSAAAPDLVRSSDPAVELDLGEIFR